VPVPTARVSVGDQCDRPELRANMNRSSGNSYSQCRLSYAPLISRTSSIPQCARLNAGGRLHASWSPLPILPQSEAYTAPTGRSARCRIANTNVLDASSLAHKFFSVILITRRCFFHDTVPPLLPVCAVCRSPSRKARHQLTSHRCRRIAAYCAQECAHLWMLRKPFSIVPA